MPEFEILPAMKASDLVVLGSSCRVIALHKATGEQIWETVLVSVFFKFGDPFVTLVVDDTGVYAHTINETFCLDLLTGRILWQKKIASLGRQVASLAMAGVTSGPAASSAAHMAAQKRQSSAD